MPISYQPESTNAAPFVIALTGFMASGKTTIGRSLAELMGRNFLDLDEEIEKRQHTTVRALFQERGEPAFRQIETEVLRNCLIRHSTPTVLALGGGAFVQSENVQLLRTARVWTVFLETPIDEMLERCRAADAERADSVRPLAGDPESFRALYQQRLPHYRRADLTVKTASKTAGELAREIAAQMPQPRRA